MRRNLKASTFLSRRDDVQDLYEPLRDVKSYVKAQRDSSKSSFLPERGPAQEAVTTLEVGAGSLLVGMLAGRMGTSQVKGVPVGLALGALAHGAAFLGLTGAAAEHVHNLGNGAIAGWLALYGAGQGTRMRQEAGQPIGAIVAGANPALMGNCGAPHERQAPAQPSYPQYAPQPRAMNPAPLPQWYQGGGNSPGNPAPLTEAELQALAQSQRGKVRGMP